MAVDDLTAQKLRELLTYNPQTGEFVRRVDRAWRKAGTPIGYSKGKCGYLRIWLLGQQYQAHRLAWLYMTGEWPRGHIDHIDGIRNNNAWENLRDVPPQMNSQNERKPRSCNHSSKYLGVSYYAKLDKWQTRIGVDGGRLHIGYFSTQEEAYEAYLAAKRRLHAGCTI